MFFEIDGKTYGVRFSRNGVSTFAELLRLDEEAGLVSTGLLGMATLYYKDIFSKSKGRKVALANLLDRMNQVSAGDAEPMFDLTKEDRKAIWDKYFERHNK